MPLGGALHPNSVHLDNALARLEHVRDQRGCLCVLYASDQFNNPAQEAERGHVQVLISAGFYFYCRAMAKRGVLTQEISGAFRRCPVSSAADGNSCGRSSSASSSPATASFNAASTDFPNPSAS